MKTRCVFVIISRSALLIMRTFSEETSRENQNSRFMFNHFFFENPAVYEILWRNIVEPDGPQMTTLRMRIACWLLKVTNTHSEHLILILMFF